MSRQVSKPKSSSPSPQSPGSTTPSARAHSNKKGGFSGTRKVGARASRKKLPPGTLTPLAPDSKFAKPDRIRYDYPKVAKHCARVIVMSNMDYLAAARYLLGDKVNHEHKPHAHHDYVGELAAKLEKDEQVQKFVQEELTVHGLDDTSKELYVKELWDWFRHGNDNRAMKAAGILGKGFIAEKIETDKPEELPIAGLGGAVRSMLGEVGDLDGLTNNNGNVTDDITVQDGTNAARDTPQSITGTASASRDLRRPILDSKLKESTEN